MELREKDDSLKKSIVITKNAKAQTNVWEFMRSTGWMMVIAIIYLVTKMIIAVLVKKPLGTITIKSPLENIERITPNIYNVDIRGYLFLYTRNSFFYSLFFRYLLERF